MSLPWMALNYLFIYFLPPVADEAEVVEEIREVIGSDACEARFTASPRMPKCVWEMRPLLS